VTIAADTLNRAAGQVDHFGIAAGGNTTVSVAVGTPMVDYSKVERVLIGGAWIEIEPGSLSYETYGHPGGPRLFWTWITPKGETAGAVATEIGFSPLVERERPAPFQAPTRPAPIECANPTCENPVSRRGQHCARCCAPDCTCDTDGPFITAEEKHEAEFLAADYERAAARARPYTPEAFNAARMAEEQRKIAARPVREADPVVDETD
jgi:hypothetical protein